MNHEKKVKFVRLRGGGSEEHLVAVLDNKVIGFSSTKGWEEPSQDNEISVREGYSEGEHLEFEEASGRKGFFVGHIQETHKMDHSFYEQLREGFPKCRQDHEIRKGKEMIETYARRNDSLPLVMPLLQGLEVRLSDLAVDSQFAEDVIAVCRKDRETARLDKQVILRLMFAKCLAVEGGLKGFRDLLTDIQTWEDLNPGHEKFMRPMKSYLYNRVDGEYGNFMRETDMLSVSY